MKPEPREAIATDLEHDPTFEAQRHVARYLIGLLINELRGVRPMGANYTQAQVLDQAELIARRYGIIAPPDELKHAPMCPSNLWAGQMIPQAPCNCGATAYAASQNKAA